MKRIVYLCLGTMLFSGCATNLSYESQIFNKAYQSISKEDLKKHLYIVASDEMEGRDTGSEGQKKSGRYLIEQYKNLGIEFPKKLKNYYQYIPSEYIGTRRGKTYPSSENILAFIEGTEKPEEIIVISAHYDHIGKNAQGEIYNGADDNGSGTVALLEIAEAFQMVKKSGKGPKRSVLLLHFTAEEIGLVGSKYYVENPVFPLSQTVANLNIDMIGRSDHDNEGKNYVYIIGSDKLSSELKAISERANKTTTNMELNYKYDNPRDPLRLYYRSDHYNFAKNNVPAAFYFNGIHKDYHKISDRPEKINYQLLEQRTRLIFATAWELANRKTRIVVDRQTP